MALSKVDSLIDSLRSLRLLEEAQLDKLRQLQARIPDHQTLIKKLLEHRWLTQFQANALLAGKGELLQIGSYVLQERLGEGGMGEVYKARNWKLGRTVALKVIRRDKALNPNTMRRFQREVQAASQVHHPNIVLAMDAGEINGRHFLAMEYVDGIDLSKLVNQKGPLPVQQACDYIRQAAWGLEHARERGMVHRDIKPSNLLISRTDGTLKILDMGLARTHEADEETMLTQEGAVLGTVDYLSPEQALDARKADCRADLYSLGCTFYFLLAGRVPFPGGTATEKLLKHRLEMPEPIEKLRPEVPLAIAAVVRKLMAKKPEERFQTPAELAAALEAGGMAPPRSMIGAMLGGLGSLLGRVPLRWWLRLGTTTAAVLAIVLLVNRFLASGETDPDAATTTAATSVAATPPGPPTPRYVKMPTREETVLATIRASGYPTLEGKWYYIGYFDNFFGRGFETAYPPESLGVDLNATYRGRQQSMVSWREMPEFRVNRHVSLGLLPNPWGSTVYLYHEIDVPRAIRMPIRVAADDSLSLWLNGERLLHEKSAPSQPRDQWLDLKQGKNQLLLKVCNGLGEFWVQIGPRMPVDLEDRFRANLLRDFPTSGD